METNISYTDGSMENIWKQIDFDIKFNDALLAKSTPSLVDICDRVQADDYKDYRYLADYFARHNITSHDASFRLFMKARVFTLLQSALTNMMNPVTFTQEPASPYYFKVSNGIASILECPVVLTRALLCFMKSAGLKCEAYKRCKSHMPDKESIIFTELALTGKTDEEMPDVFKPLAKACKAIRGKINPWYSEIEPAKFFSTGDPVGHNEANLRFRGAEWFDAARKDICLIGAGGLGSNIAVSLCRVLGDKNLTIYDDDTVEYRNLAGQNFGINDIGRLKTAVVAEYCKDFNPTLNTIVRNHRYDVGDTAYPIMITGLDNMVARKLVYDKWKGYAQVYGSSKCLLIDARLSAEKWQIFCIQGSDEAAQQAYEDKWLFSDDEADSDICSYKQTAFAAQMCASFVTNMYINFCTNTTKEEDDPTRRFLPFFTEYDASQMILRYKEA